MGGSEVPRHDAHTSKNKCVNFHSTSRRPQFGAIADAGAGAPLNRWGGLTDRYRSLLVPAEKKAWREREFLGIVLNRCFEANLRRLADRQGWGLEWLPGLDLNCNAFLVCLVYVSLFWVIRYLA